MVLAIRNIQLFIAFRVLFNNRFYYPVFTILFLDYGLTVEQFSLLNTVWAITIVLAEVPSGALADVIGRKTLLMATAVLMVIEMSLLAFVPLGDGQLIFTIFFINRVCSGLAEALTSGADEAMAYDSLVERGLEDRWPQVLSIQMRCSSLAFVVSSITGSMIYDPQMMNRLLALLGLTGGLTQQDTMRFPIYATLLLAVAALVVAISFQEKRSLCGSQGFSRQMAASLRLIAAAGRWIIRTPFAVAIIACGMFYDHILRLTVTLTSQYFRLIALPEASFGFINAAVSLMGIFVPRLAEKLIVRYSPQQNMLLLALLALAGLTVLALFWPYVGIIAILLVFMGMMLTSFFTSHYLNRITDSGQRATVLSFKGLVFNLGYGLIGFVFALAIAYARGPNQALHPGWSERQIADAAFVSTVGWFPWYTLALLLLIVPLLRWLLAGRREHLEKG